MKRKNAILRYWPALLCAALMVISLTCFRLVVTDGPSMEPTYSPGDLLLCVVPYRQPRDGDVILMEKDGMLMVKRISAVAGEAAPQTADGDVQAVQIPEGYVFVTGDNAEESFDSRDEGFGLVALEQIRGYILLTLREAG